MEGKKRVFFFKFRSGCRHQECGNFCQNPDDSGTTEKRRVSNAMRILEQIVKLGEDEVLIDYFVESRVPGQEMLLTKNRVGISISVKLTKAHPTLARPSWADWRQVSKQFLNDKIGKLADAMRGEDGDLIEMLGKLEPLKQEWGQEGSVSLPPKLAHGAVEFGSMFSAVATIPTQLWHETLPKDTYIQEE